MALVLAMLLASQEDGFFSTEVWAKVGERTCLNCHTPTGDAAESKLLLRSLESGPDALKHNQAAFEKMARTKKDGKSRLLAKSTGGLEHGGGAQLKPGTTGLRIVEEWVKRLDAGVAAKPAPAEKPFFQGIRQADPLLLLRRLTLSLAGRLPTEEEKARVRTGGRDAVGAVLDGVLREEAFYDRLKEGFNDILLTLGYAGNGEDALAYDHFEKTRLWAEKHDLSHIPEKDRQKARYKLWDDYRKALLHEPLELIKHIVKEGKPFTEIVTADYFMVSPYTSRGYGIFDAVKDRFKNVDDPFEYVPAQLPALKARSGKVQETGKGIYPHAGLLTLFQYLRRYPTTVTNRNRLRARMYFQHFLGVDVMALAPRVTDAAEVAKKFANPTMEASDCVVCHKTIDPIAGLFQDYFNEEGHYGPRKEGWFTDMFGSGREGLDLPKEERWRSLQWLGAETAKDPRFAVAMVEHVYHLLMGRKVPQAPQDIDEPHFAARRRAYQELRREIRAQAERFAKSNFDLRAAFKGLALSPFYGVDGLAEAALTPSRRAELDDVGIVHLLSPEQVERKIAAIFGKPWGRLREQLAVLYGGIDSKEVTQRLSDPSGAMGAIQRILANDVACKFAALDFAEEPGKRLLFPGIELDVLPGSSPEADSRIRSAMVHLHERVLGRVRSPRDPEIDRMYRLFDAIVTEARATKGWDKNENYFCRGGEGRKAVDPHYTLRAWRAVLTFLLRQDEFLYE
jgi:hypothetical protein